MKRKLGTFYIVDFVRGILHCAFLGLSIAAAVNRWPNVWVVIFVVAFLLCLLWGIAKPLLSRERLAVLDWIEVSYHFITAVILLVVDVVSFNDFFSNSTIQIICVLATGFFTLYGVALSIRFNMWNEQDKERGKAKPHIFPVSKETWAKTKEELIKTKSITEKYSSLTKVDKRKKHFLINELHIYNSDASTCFFKGLFINKEKFLIFKYDEVLNKDSYNCFVVDKAFIENEINNIYFILGDILDNVYLSKVSFEIVKKDKKCSEIEMHGVLNTILRNDIDCDKIVIKYYEKMYNISKRNKKSTKKNK